MTYQNDIFPNKYINKRFFFTLNPDDEKLILDFFVVFSRFEYALKESGYFWGDNSQVKPDWNKYCERFKNEFNSTKTPELEIACEYYLKFPPMKQVVIDERISWKQRRQGSESDFSFIVNSIKTVRNNLFHGGKFPYAQQRDNALIKHGLVILDHCLDLDQSLSNKFTIPAI